MKDCNELIKIYPELYADPYPESRSKHSMQWGGFETGNGWYDLLDKVSKKISDHLKENPIEGFHVQQVKEKFGGLRYYTSSYDDAIQELINDAEKEADETCERCGSKENVKTRGKGWIVTWCDKCFEAQEKKSC